MKKVLSIVCAIGCFALAAPVLAQGVAHPAALAAGFYVSPNGSDSNAGTLAAPFLTLGKCQTSMQGGNKICYIRAGTYALPVGGLSLVAADVGETYQYYPPDGINSAIISGASPCGASTFAVQSTTTATGLTFNGLQFTSCGYIWFFSQGANTNWLNNLIDGTGVANSQYVFDIYGNNTVVYGNTVQNINNATPGGPARGMQINATGFTNSVVKNNSFNCIANYGILSDTSSTTTGNIFANNNIFNTGIVGGGASPNCTTVVDISGTGVDLLVGATNNLFVGNNIGGTLGAEGYAIVSTLNTTGTGAATATNYISDNTLFTNSDPAITLNGSGGTVIRRNTVSSPGSIGFNLGDEHDFCFRGNTSNTLLISNNTITSINEPIWLTSTNHSNIFGNILGIGGQLTPAVTGTFTGVIGPASTTLTTSALTGSITAGPTTPARGAGLAANTLITAGTGPTYTVSISQSVSSEPMNAGASSPHYPAGISFINWQYADFCSSFIQANNNNTITNNTITSNAGTAKYGVYLEALGAAGNAGYSVQTANTISHNILFPFGSSGTAALSDNSGGSNTAADNQISGGTSVTAAPPTANAGASQVVAGGQLVTLNGSSTANFPSGGTSGVTYAWSQLSGPVVTLSNTSVASPTFTAPPRPAGQTATITIANPAVITVGASPLINTPIKFSTTGTLPSHITAGTTYYVISAGYAPTTFEISATLGGSAISTLADSQSGTQTMTPLTQASVMVFQLTATNGNGSTSDEVMVGLDPSI